MFLQILRANLRKVAEEAERQRKEEEEEEERKKKEEEEEKKRKAEEFEQNERDKDKEYEEVGQMNKHTAKQIKKIIFLQMDLIGTV